MAPGRDVYCNRTLNMRSIHAIGYDMDYTLIHYHVAEWERRAYEHVRARLVERGWPVDELRFDPASVIRGLVIDTERGNLVKANRFGFVKKANHGTRALGFDEMRDAYAREIVDLGEPRWVFLNTLFSLSEGCLYAQLVDLLDAGKLPGPMGYAELHGRVVELLNRTHVEGQLKGEIMADPGRYVDLDAGTRLALEDQRAAGKKIFLVTNSDWSYTSAMMRFAFGDGWRGLFDLVIIGARKPDFFTSSAPFFAIATPDGLLRPDVAALEPGGAYLGGSAQRLEKELGIAGDEILYVGDHMFGDVHFTKRVLRWRTALILRELEGEVEAIEASHPAERELVRRMDDKEILERQIAATRLALARLRHGHGPRPSETEAELEARMLAIKTELAARDAAIAPMAKAMAEISNHEWGLLTRAGNDKSHLARQIERYADIYTSRVSNFVALTPYAYLRSRRGSMPHDPAPEP
jgi:HAD superfamily 5'-nucleotidase-like hydrolase